MQHLSSTPPKTSHQLANEPISPISSVSKFGGSTTPGLKKADPPVDLHSHHSAQQGGGSQIGGLFINPETELEVHMNVSELRGLASSYKQHSIQDLGMKKQKQLQIRLAAGIDQLGYTPLKSSRIVLPDEVESLYYCLPFFSKPPMLKPLYSTYTHRRSLEELFNKTIKVSLNFYFFYDYFFIHTFITHLESQPNPFTYSIRGLSLRCLFESCPSSYKCLDGKSIMLHF